MENFDKSIAELKAMKAKQNDETPDWMRVRENPFPPDPTTSADEKAKTQEFLNQKWNHLSEVAAGASGKNEFQIDDTQFGV